MPLSSHSLPYQTLGCIQQREVGEVKKQYRVSDLKQCKVVNLLELWGQVSILDNEQVSDQLSVPTILLMATWTSSWSGGKKAFLTIPVNHLRNKVR